MKSRNKKIESYFTKPGVEVGNIGLSKEDIKTSFLEKLFYSLGRIPVVATPNDLYTSLALAVRDRVFRKYVKSLEQYAEEDARGVAYLSAEYLPGPHLGNNLLNLEIMEETREALAELNLDLEELLKEEVEPGLGNGGLGRLASCYMDSLATLGIPSIAYGIRYEFGIFKQEIKEGWQVESTDKWLHNGNPWEVIRPEISFEVKFGGYTEHTRDENDKLHIEWIPGSEVKGTAYDTPILGYQSNGIILRLWKAEATESFDFAAYNLGDYYRAVEKKMRSENITKVLYPNDENLSGKELRLKQQYFFVCCSLQDIIRLHLLQGRKLESLHEKFTIQLNDTHPSIAVPELMRLLVDVYHMEWDAAWMVTCKTFAYTNHTLLPEALERWPVSLIRNLLPRHLEIIYEINSRFINELRGHNFTGDQISRMSLVDESGEPTIRMAHLATVGSYMINGVSALHSGLLKKQVLKDFAELWPNKFTNVTNGVTHRRFLAVSNPGLSALLSEKIGKDWLTHLDKLKGLESYSEDETFRRKWMEVKLENKRNLATQIKELTGIDINPEMLIDVQVKRIHEYKRQHLKVLHILSLYLRVKKEKDTSIPPTAFVFGGKAAPGYFMAKRIIKLITAVGELINNDPEVNKILKVVFLPNFSVKLAQHVYPGADLSEQISMAGKEASGTGNMKFALNGALTIGTLDGANVEIREEVGEENFFLFGLTTDEVENKKAQGYHPYKIYAENENLKKVMEFLLSDELTRGDTELFKPIYNNLLHQDPYLLMEDYQSYIEQMENVYHVWQDREKWAKMSILNVARMGKFSSDRSIQDYCEKIWKVEAIKV
ncbi:glycogen/starch/alpha-glucan phosphorylase [Antarcticibacterium flavum]|uniref:Alpha-1,4 glucan phosphorylase n=1 Tax=Antarcticibacterium flavum TaxID=2058175 RepID=A0A5B7WZL0_9FLAO|nr:MULTISPECIES: glycogen/starch/alpha-glucan phosphorylase [Antarcticibacterium]MCM4158644.1 glycogen phosphorylase [Antarcticibacterium sp. W02-3]QCY68499.1 glycogen/starch/alpha-glucan phosphorylase [Antarcticibacterium flavum]